MGEGGRIERESKSNIRVKHDTNCFGFNVCVCVFNKITVCTGAKGMKQ